MKKILKITLLLCATALFASAQTSMYGKVTDGDTGEELIAANVTLYKGGICITGVTTDYEGNYSINLDPGTYDVSFSYVGYSAKEIGGVIVRAGQANKQDVQLTTGINYEIGLQGLSQNKKVEADTTNENYPASLVSFSDFQNLVSEIEEHRKQRLISLDTFLKMKNEVNTIILDARSKNRYNRKHLKGAKHLAFTEFTQYNLDRLIGNKDVRILIYCNNNFDGDQIDFASKMSIPNRNQDGEILPNRKPIMLALNIPTYLTLYGYGFKNIYELGELVKVGDPRIEFEGTHVREVLSIRRFESLRFRPKE